MRERGTGEADARVDAQQALRDVEQTGEMRAAAGEHATSAHRFKHAALTEIVAEHLEELAGTGLEDFGDEALANHARLVAGEAGDFDFADLIDRGHDGVAVIALEPLGFRGGDVEADGEVVGEVIATDGDDRGVGDGAFEEDDQLGSGGADVEEADAELALVCTERGFRSGEGLEDGLGDFEAGLVDAGDDALLCAGGAGGDVQIDFEAIADHAHGIMNAGLLVEDELLGEEVEDFAIGGEGDGTGAIDGGADIVFANISRRRVPRLMPPRLLTPRMWGPPTATTKRSMTACPEFSAMTAARSMAAAAGARSEMSPLRMPAASQMPWPR